MIKGVLLFGAILIYIIPVPLLPLNKPGEIHKTRKEDEGGRVVVHDVSSVKLSPHKMYSWSKVNVFLRR